MSDILHERARIASLSRSRPSDDPELVDAKRGLDAAKISDYIERVLAEAPPLTDAQRTALAELLRPVRVNCGPVDDTAEPSVKKQSRGRSRRADRGAA